MSQQTHGRIMLGALVLALIAIAFLAPSAHAAPRKPMNVVAINMHLPTPTVSKTTVYHTPLANKTILVWRPIALAVGKRSAKCEFSFDFANKMFVLDRNVRSGKHWLTVRLQLSFEMYSNPTVNAAACRGAIL